MSGPATGLALERLARPLRLRYWSGWVATALGAAALLLGLAAWLVRLGVVASPWWVLAAWAAAFAALAASALLARRRGAALRLPSLARAIEAVGGWRQGAISALLDAPARGTSAELFDLADASRAEELAVRGRAAAAPLARGATRRLLLGGACLAVGLAILAGAGPVRGTAAALWYPRRAWEMTVAPVRLRADAEVVDRGARVGLALEAVGRRHVTLWLRVPGEPWRPSLVELDSTGRARLLTPPLESDLFARATAGRRSSDTVAVRVRSPVFLGTLSVTAHYPAYLGLDPDPIPTTGDTVRVPAGTRLETRGEATAPLAGAAWVGERGVESLAVAARRFSGSFVPRGSGVYRLALASASGAPLGGDTLRLPIRVIKDSAPQVEIAVPGADTVAPLSLQLSLVIDVRDDHGIRAVAVESRRIGRVGGADPPVRETVPLPPGAPNPSILPFTLDLNRRGLLPGDTVRYFALATDNTPEGQVGRSREFVLRLPTLSEVRAAERRNARAIGGRLDSLAARSRRLERQTEDLARERPRAPGRDPRNPEALPYEEAKRAEAVASAQHELVREAESLKQALETLERSAEAAGLRDSAWQRQLQEIRQQLARALTPELRERLEALQKALKDLNAEDAKQALEDLAERQRRLREALEQSRELFRRAAIEGDLANLAHEVRDLVREQRGWVQQVPATDTARAAAAERELAGRTDSLAGALRQLAPELGEARRQALSGLGDRAAEAAQRMRRAAQAAQAGRRPAAEQEGRRAAEQLEPVGDELTRQRAGLQEEWRREVTDALDRALAETSRLAERQLALAKALGRGVPPAASRADQAAVEEGVERLQNQVRQLAGRNALVSPDIAQALALAQLHMQRSREAVSSALANPGEAAERAGDAVDALNAAAYRLLRTRNEVGGSASGTGLAEALERLNRLAAQQGQLAQQTGGLLPMMGGGEYAQRLQQLGERQRRLAEELEKLKGQGTIAGAGEMADEAQDIARRMEERQVDREVVRRQERLFRRMLDAGRTLQGREEDQQKERSSTTARDDSVHLPPPLRPGEEGPRVRVPSWEELQGLSPEERRLVMDYFRRLTEEGR